MKKLPFISLVSSMTIFGTIGIFVRFLSLPSGFVAMSRGFVGAFFVVLFLLISRKGISFSAIKRNLPILLISGVFIGVNWILLFESYNYTEISTATLCYYMSPVFVTVFSFVFFKERVTVKKIACISSAFLGIFFVSGVIKGSLPTGKELIGIILALCAALCYSTVTLINKKSKQISPLDMTAVQLFAAAVTVLPYTLIFERVYATDFDIKRILLLALVGILHTGVAYVFYFTSVTHLPASKVAIFSYLDPIVAILLSAIIFREKLGVFEIIGAVLILVSAFVGEINLSLVFRRKEKN